MKTVKGDMIWQLTSKSWPPFAAVTIHLKILGPEPAFGRLGLGGSSGGYSSHGYTSHASLRACGAQLGGDLSKHQC